MDIFSKIPENPIFLLKNNDFSDFGHRIFFATPGQILVQHSGQTIRPRMIKIGMHLPEYTSYEHFFENFKNSFFPQKYDFRKFGLRILFAAREQI